MLGKGFPCGRGVGPSLLSKEGEGEKKLSRPKRGVKISQLDLGRAYGSVFVMEEGTKGRAWRRK